MYRRRIGLVAITGIAIGAAIIGPKIYADRMTPPLPLSTSTSASATSQSSPSDVNGEWVVSTGSFAGYRVRDIPENPTGDIFRRTQQVIGTVTVAEDIMANAAIEVDLASITTGAGHRDDYFRHKAIDTQLYPTATFVATMPVDVSQGAGSIDVPGELTIAEHTQPVTANANVVHGGSGLVVSGTVPVQWSDFGIATPQLGAVGPDSAVDIEFFLNLSK